MPDKKISALTAGSALGGTEKIPMAQSSSTVYTTPAAIRTYLDAYYAPLQSILWVRDEKSSGTASQSLTATTWNKRDLGTTKINTIPGASVASSVITLPAGTYEVAAFGLSSNTVTDSTGHQIRLYNTSDSALLVQGSSARLNTLNTAQNASIIQNSYFTLAATKNIELQHWTSATNRGGSAVSSGSDEVYAEVFIRKVA